MERSSRRVVDDDRLAGVWLRQSSSEYVFYAPVGLPDGALGIVRVEVRTIGGYARRTIAWALYCRFGLRDSGELDLPAMAYRQALAHVERELAGRGVRFDATLGGHDSPG